MEGRALDYAFVGGSIPPSSDPLWKRFENLGIEVEKQERGAGTGGEVAVDEILQLSMANRVLDVVPPRGHGALDRRRKRLHRRQGFIKALERAHQHGWGIEVVSWDAGCNRHLRHFAQTNGTYRALEPVCEKVTFINNKRWAQPV